MSIQSDGHRLQIFLGESDRHHGKPLYQAIVEKARALQLRGATVQRGSMGFGANSHVHIASVLRLSSDLPVTITIVDGREKIDEFLPHLDEMLQGGLVTLEPVEVLDYRAHPAAEGGEGAK